ncbi:TVP38/TMEM64 family protein [Secundilactobacillus collinoides]|uniref:TVP38/TMEM64 family membrane protein n=2 Tax=Secundilactobacillus collinoides TaxID=33960 RepID=A0A0R2BD01_SECCO|nr:VTT domain-containing protein [Secundilactobacillus collinoides]KRM77150.1 hypothetical protein FC82_GL000389 [Secundilactobacillus collinoides DSM 20515 = JCM 1123]KZL41014.1 hypothetical protein TY91_07115 [Secundilactobacillus collinoides]
MKLEKPETKKQRLIRLAFVLLGILIIVGLLYALSKDFQQDIDNLVKYNDGLQKQFWAQIRQHQTAPVTLLIVFALVATLAAVPGFPISVACILIGVIYGRYWGFAINLVGIVCGNLVTYTILRKVGISKAAQHHDGRVVRNIMKMKYPVVGLTIGYAVPIVPTIFVNFAASKLHQPLRDVIIAMAIGSVPTALLYAMGGDFLNRGDYKIALITVLAVGVLFLLVWQLWKREETHTEKEV